MSWLFSDDFAEPIGPYCTLIDVVARMRLVAAGATRARAGAGCRCLNLRRSICHRPQSSPAQPSHLPRDLRSAPELSNEFQHVYALWIELRGRIPIRAFTEP